MYHKHTKAFELFQKHMFFKTLNDCLCTRFIYDGADVVLEVSAGGRSAYGGNASNEVIWAWVNAPGLDQPVERIAFINGEARQRQVFHADGLGSIAALTDESGATVQTYTYAAFGGIRTRTDTDLNRVTFTAREALGDSLGFYYYRHRVLDPTTGRFTSEDPLGFVDGANRVVYVGNNPINFTDPHGLWQVTIGGGYGYAGRITFGKNQGRWNIGFGFGYGVGLMGSFSPEDIDPSYASRDLSVNIGVEVSGETKLLGLDISGGLGGVTEADKCNNVETRIGGFGAMRIPGTIVNVGGSADVVGRGDLDCGTAEYFGELQRSPIEIGVGGMVFGGVTGGIAWGGM